MNCSRLNYQVLEQPEPSLSVEFLEHFNYNPLWPSVKGGQMTQTLTGWRVSKTFIAL